MNVQNLPWEKVSPESVGIDSGAVIRLLDAFSENPKAELQALMIVRHGKLAVAGLAAPYREEDKGLVYSVSKSFTSTAIGIAVSEGLLTVEDQVISYFPEYLPEEISDNLAAMRVKDLLTMTTGHDEDTLPLLIKHRGAEDNWISVFFRTPVLHKPGTHFLYNSGATYLLAAILQKVSGQGMIDYLTPRLFEPLGIEGARWDVSAHGIVSGGWGLSVGAADMMKLGMLYLQHGVYNGKRILPEEWVTAATKKQVDNHDWNPDAGPDWLQGYGYQFWGCVPGFYRADGAFGQYIIVIDKLDTVIVVKSESDDMQSELTAIWEELLPGIGEVLPENEASCREMERRLASLSLPMQEESGPDRPFRTTAKLMENPFGITDVAVEVRDGVCHIGYHIKDIAFTMEAGYQSYLYNEMKQFPLFPDMLPSVFGRKRDTTLACCYGWERESLLLRWQYLGSPHHLDIIMEAGDDLKITAFNSRNHEKYELIGK